MHAEPLADGDQRAGHRVLERPLRQGERRRRRWCRAGRARRAPPAGRSPAARPRDARSGPAGSPHAPLSATPPGSGMDTTSGGACGRSFSRSSACSDDHAVIVADRPGQPRLLADRPAPPGGSAQATVGGWSATTARSQPASSRPLRRTARRPPCVRSRSAWKLPSSRARNGGAVAVQRQAGRAGPAGDADRQVGAGGNRHAAAPVPRPSGTPARDACRRAG